METNGKTADQGSVGTLDQAVVTPPVVQEVNPNVLPEGFMEEVLFGHTIRLNKAGQPARKEDANTLCQIEEFLGVLSLLKKAEKLTSDCGFNVDLSNPGNLLMFVKCITKATNWTVSVEGGSFTIPQLFTKTKAATRRAAIVRGVS